MVVFAMGPPAPGGIMTERTSAESRTCEKCGRPMVTGAKLALCPACMFDVPASDDTDHALVRDETDELEHRPAVPTADSASNETGNDKPATSAEDDVNRSKRAPTTVPDRGPPEVANGPPGEPPRTPISGPMWHGRWILVVLYVVLAAGAIARLVWAERETREPTDLSYMIQSGEFTVDGALKGCKTPYPDPSQLSWYAVRRLPTIVRSADGTLEIGPDDHISKIVGEDFLRKVNGISVDDPAIGQILDASPQDRNRWVSLGSDGRSSEIAFLRIMMGTYWARLLSGLSIGALGVVAFWLLPGRKSTAGFLVACLSVALLWYARSVPFHLRLGAENFVYYLMQSYIAVPFVLFMVTFTPLRLVVTRPLYAGLAAAIPATLLVVINGVIDPFAMMHGYLIRPLFRLWALYMILLIVITVPFGLWCRALKIQVTPTDKARSRIVGVAVLISFAPLIVFTLFDLDADSTYSMRLVPEIGVVLFPLLILYAIARHNLLRMSELLREGLIYGLLSIALLGLYAVVAATTTALFANVAQGYLQSLAVGGTVMIAIPSHAVMRKAIRRRLEIPPEEYDDLLHRLDEIARAAPSPDGYCRDVVQFLERVTKSDRISILVREPGDVDWKISDSHIGPGLTPISPSCSPLIQELESSHSEIFVDDLLDELHVPRSLETPLQGLQALEANALLPLSARNQLVGALALGARVDERNHSARELKLYKRLSGHIANALVQMFDRLRAASGNRIVDIYPDCPKRIGNYIIERVLGEGGMSYVYLGHNSLGSAAIKVCNRFVQSDRKLLERFHREGAALSRMRHANIVPIMDVGWEGPEPFMAMEYFERGSLDDVIERDGPCSEAVSMRYLLGAVRGLIAAQEEGVIHRDIKPTNLFVTNDNQVKIGDFGLARLADQSTLTREGEIFGTPHFMSPEILRGQTADWTADQYALGISLYFVLTGNLPFEGDNMESIHFQHVNSSIPDMRQRRPELSVACSDVIARMAAKRQEDRFHSYRQIEHAAQVILKKTI